MWAYFLSFAPDNLLDLFVLLPTYVYLNVTETVSTGTVAQTLLSRKLEDRQVYIAGQSQYYLVLMMTIQKCVTLNRNPYACTLITPNRVCNKAAQNTSINQSQIITLLVSIPWLTSWGSPSVGWEGRVCSHFPMPAHTVNVQMQCYTPLEQLQLKLQGFSYWSLSWSKHTKSGDSGNLYWILCIVGGGGGGDLTCSLLILIPS